MNSDVTLLDYFAGKVVQGMYGNPQFKKHSQESIAFYAYVQAQAMLAEREKHPQTRCEVTLNDLNAK